MKCSEHGGYWRLGLVWSARRLNIPLPKQTRQWLVPKIGNVLIISYSNCKTVFQGRLILTDIFESRRSSMLLEQEI